MQTEVVAIGTELLLGQIVDTNSSWIGEQLALGGIDSFFQTKVGDNLARVESALRLALQRSDAVICCGGLGPTQDDLTRDAIASVLGVPLDRDEEMVDRIRSMFAGRGRAMPENNLRQADRPRGTEFIKEQPGTAAGLRCELVWPLEDGTSAKRVVYALPGVPWELKEMFHGTVLPDLKVRAGINSVIASRTLRTWGESESGLAERLSERIDALDVTGNPTLAFLASGIEGLKVRITAKGADLAEAHGLLAAEEAQVRAVLGDLVFGVDDQTMESAVLDELIKRNLTVGVAESLTGGMIGSRICDVPGASRAFRGSLVSYASDVKFDLLDVPAGPVVTEEVALAMARGARRLLKADVGIAATGVAGPERAEGLAPGTVCIAVAVGDPDDGGTAETTTLRMPGRRQQVREFTAISLLGLLRRHLGELDPGSDVSGSPTGASTDANGDRGGAEPTDQVNAAARSVWGRSAKQSEGGPAR